MRWPGRGDTHGPASVPSKWRVATAALPLPRRAPPNSPDPSGTALKAPIRLLACRTALPPPFTSQSLAHPGGVGGGVGGHAVPLCIPTLVLCPHLTQATSTHTAHHKWLHDMQLARMASTWHVIHNAAPPCSSSPAAWSMQLAGPCRKKISATACCAAERGSQQVAVSFLLQWHTATSRSACML